MKAEALRIDVDRLLDGLAGFLLGQGGQQLFSRSADLILGILVSLTFAIIGHNHFGWREDHCAAIRHQ